MSEPMTEAETIAAVEADDPDLARQILLDAGADPARIRIEAMTFGRKGNASTVTGTVSGGSVSMTANGGAPGKRDHANWPGGAGGTASGGTTNMTGSAGENGDGGFDSGAGGDAAGPDGGAGGFANAEDGAAPGGGGAGGAAFGSSTQGGDGARGQVEFYYT